MNIKGNANFAAYGTPYLGIRICDLFSPTRLSHFTMSKPLERFCAFCGRPFDDPQAAWPRVCLCGMTTYRNPLPVVNLIVPVISHDQTGVLLIQRGIDPCRGQWAFPGGFMELNETWQSGAARELREETGLRVANPDSAIQLLHVDESPRLDEIIVIGIAPTLRHQTMPKIPINEEVTASRIAFEPEELAFPAHTHAMEKFFHRLRHENSASLLPQT